MAEQKIYWTKTDEAPALATLSFLPIVKAFTKEAGIQIEEKDISLAGRILATFPEHLKEGQKVPDNLAFLGELTLNPEANIIKLPNISASVPQLEAAIKELRSQGYDVPEYPENPKTPEEEKIKERYSKVLGSAVNPVLREGNSDRRVPVSVIKYAHSHPHALKAWNKDSHARIAHMSAGDFYGNEKAAVMPKDDELSINFISAAGQKKLLKKVAVKEGEIVDGTFMDVYALRAFYKETLDIAKEENLLWSVHLKATMMKVSDPVLFGHAVHTFFRPVFDKYGETFEKIGVNQNMGMGDLLAKIETLPEEEKNAIKADIQKVYDERPAIAMVDSAKGITNLHMPNQVIIDASLPVVIRDGGKMWNKNGELQETLALVPDRSYAQIYEAMFNDCREKGAFNPATMGSVENIGLMAQKAEEYGSHPTTFILPATGIVQVEDGEGKLLFAHRVHKGDIWRMSHVRDIPVRDWVKLAVKRTRQTGNPAVFWLDSCRAHDCLLREKVEKYLKEYDTNGLDIKIMNPDDALIYSNDIVRQGKDAISVTGNVLRDYLTDLYPILEIGTSAKMLSIVPLLAGGGLFETGAGGSAPKHVQQFQEEDYLRWDSLGEFSALGASLEQLGHANDNKKALVLAKALDEAIALFLENNKSPARKVGQIDDRGSHYYLAMYWAKALAAQNDDEAIKAKFLPVADALAKNEEQINKELIGAQGHKVDMGGYYHPDMAKTTAAMRPSKTLNDIIDAI